MTLLHIYVGAWQNVVQQYAAEVLCSSYGAGPSLSPGVFRTTRGRVLSRAGVRVAVPVALISGPFGLSLNRDLCVEELFHALWFTATHKSGN